MKTTWSTGVVNLDVHANPREVLGTLTSQPISLSSIKPKGPPGTSSLNCLSKVVGIQNLEQFVAFCLGVPPQKQIVVNIRGFEVIFLMQWKCIRNTDLVIQHLGSLYPRGPTHKIFRTSEWIEYEWRVLHGTRDEGYPQVASDAFPEFGCVSYLFFQVAVFENRSRIKSNWKGWEIILGLSTPRNKIRAAVERGERDPIYMMLPSYKIFVIHLFFCWQVWEAPKPIPHNLQYAHLIPPKAYLDFSIEVGFGPRIDELDEDTVYYWCNVRTEGSLKQRESQGLHVSTTAQGSTDKFNATLMGKKLDLKALGHNGPSKQDAKVVKARGANNVQGLCFSKKYTLFRISARNSFSQKLYIVFWLGFLFNGCFNSWPLVPPCLRHMSWPPTLMRSWRSLARLSSLWRNSGRALRKGPKRHLFCNGM